MKNGELTIKMEAEILLIKRNEIKLATIRLEKDGKLKTMLVKKCECLFKRTNNS